ncbi:hypothetical protein GOP47_0001371 [Adiantum capillus-veneris]|uniref:Uncharacterized protein n=1 Tax=Adiantum capillus-veneris TaxID=13818 RepID=A0A9D4V8K2_ADICA|nr:hypothetical protein GOP47_0001371 [Adiantum capillus-veneris]
MSVKIATQWKVLVVRVNQTEPSLLNIFKRLGLQLSDVPNHSVMMMMMCKHSCHTSHTKHLFQAPAGWGTCYQSVLGPLNQTQMTNSKQTAWYVKDYHPAASVDDLAIRAFQQRTLHGRGSPRQLRMVLR